MFDPFIDKISTPISLNINRDYPTLGPEFRVPIVFNASDALVTPAGLDNIGAGTLTVVLILSLSCA